MTEEQQEQPTTPESPKESLPIENKPKKRNLSKIELLPPEALKEIDSLLLNSHGAMSIKKAIESRYLDKAVGILPASYLTYQNYINVRREQLKQQNELQQSLVESTKEGLIDVQGVINVVTNTSLENKKNVFENIYRRIENRIQLLERTQHQAGFVNSQLESVIGAYIREQRTIIEKLVLLRGDLEKDNAEQLYNEFENLIYVWLVTVLNTYKSFHGDEKIGEFKSKLNEDLKKVLENYRVNKGKQ